MNGRFLFQCYAIFWKLNTEMQGGEAALKFVPEFWHRMCPPGLL